MINPIEAEFLCRCIDTWAEDVTRALERRPLIFTTQDRYYEEEVEEVEVLLTTDQIDALYERLMKHAA